VVARQCGVTCSSVLHVEAGACVLMYTWCLVCRVGVARLARPDLDRTRRCVTVRRVARSAETQSLQFRCRAHAVAAVSQCGVPVRSSVARWHSPQTTQSTGHRPITDQPTGQSQCGVCGAYVTDGTCGVCLRDARTRLRVDIYRIFIYLSFMRVAYILLFRIMRRSVAFS
jgi:hypothetical protein